MRLTFTVDANLPCSLDSPVERAGMSPLDRATPARPDRARLGPSRGKSRVHRAKREPARALHRLGSRTGPNASDRPDRHALGPGKSSASYASSNGLLMAVQAMQCDSTLMEVRGEVGSEEKFCRSWAVALHTPFEMQSTSTGMVSSSCACWVAAVAPTWQEIVDHVCLPDQYLGGVEGRHPSLEKTLTW